MSSSTSKFQVALIDDEVVLDWPFHAESVNEFKKLPGAKWDRLAKVWRIPATRLDDVRTFALKWGLTMSEEVEFLSLPAQPPSAHLERSTSKSGGYFLHFPFENVKVSAVKNLPGAVWDTRHKAWKCPETSLPQIIEFAERFGLAIPDEIREIQASVVARQNHLLALSSAQDADLVISGLRGELLPFQRAGVSYAIKTRRLFIADDMGAGKTIEALAALEWSALHDLPTYPCLIVCPPKLTLNWSYEIERWLPHRTTLILKGRPTSDDMNDLLSLLALNDQIRKHCLQCSEHVFTTTTVPTIDASSSILGVGLPVDLAPKAFTHEIKNSSTNLSDVEPEVTMLTPNAAFSIKEPSDVGYLSRARGDSGSFPGNMNPSETPLVDSIMRDRVGGSSCDFGDFRAFEALVEKLNASVFHFGTHSNSLSHIDFLIVGWATLKDWAPALINSSIISCIYDESHAIKRYEAARTRAAIKIAKAADPKGMLMLLTGTPITNRPAEYAAQLEALGRLTEFGGKWAFYKRHANAFQDRWGHWHIDGHSNLEELNVRLRAGGMYLRRNKADILPQLKPISRTKLMVEPDAKLMVEYRQAEADIASYMAQRAAELALELGTSPTSAAVRARLKAESAQFLVRIAALRRLAALAKLDTAQEWIESAVEEGHKIIVFGHHRDVVDAVALRFGGLKIQGGQSTAEVERVKKLFQEGSVEDAPVIVVSIMAGGQGHNLTKADHVLFIELPWSPSDVEQAIARAHRIGQENQVQATFLIAENTVDEDIWALLEEKKQVVDAAIEGDSTTRDKMGSMLMRLVKKGLSLGSHSPIEAGD